MQRLQWRFQFDGKPYEFRGYVPAPDAILLKKHAGLGVLSFFDGVISGDPEALVGLVFVAKRQAGELITWDELVEQLVGENDLIALVESIEPIDPTPAAQDTPAAQEPPEPAPAA